MLRQCPIDTYHGASGQSILWWLVIESSPPKKESFLAMFFKEHLKLISLRPSSVVRSEVIDGPHF